MGMEKWDPFNDLVRLRNIFNEMFEQTFKRQVIEGGLAAGLWAPSADVYENDDDIVVAAEIPGVKQEDVHLEYNGNQLTIKGECQVPYREGEAAYHRVERFHGPFKREVPIPARIDPAGIKAKLESGVLTVTLPLDPQTKKAKNIPIAIKPD